MLDFLKIVADLDSSLYLIPYIIYIYTVQNKRNGMIMKERVSY